MAQPYRCRHGKCRKRVKLSKPIEKYKRKPKCPACGGELILDKYRKTTEHKKTNCFCDGLHWDGPHRKGSSVWCRHHPTGPTDKDYEERYGK